jgi:nickel/cobalt transporter (NicO) family protein
VLLISSTFLLGFLHGLGADHLMAIAALSLGTAGESVAIRRARALGVAVRFAVGHALLLALGAGILIAFGWSLPIVVERGGEMLGGSLLIVLGGVGLWGIAAGRVYGHAHPEGYAAAAQWHLHIGHQHRHPLPSAHSHLPTVIGAAFAISSLRALTLLEGFDARAAAAPLPLIFGLVAVFAVGILISMSLFGVAFARLMSARTLQRVSTAAAGTMAVASIALGAFWIVSAWGSRTV